MDMDGQTGKNHVSDPEKIPSDKSELQDNQGKSLQNKNGAQLDSNENESGEASFQVGQVLYYIITISSSDHYNYVVPRMNLGFLFQNLKEKIKV